MSIGWTSNEFDDVVQHHLSKYLAPVDQIRLKVVCHKWKRMISIHRTYYNGAVDIPKKFQDFMAASAKSKHIQLFKVRFNPDLLRMLQENLERNDEIEILATDFGEFDESTFWSFCKIIESSKSLQKLRIRPFSPLTGAFANLTSALAANPSITSLNLWTALIHSFDIKGLLQSLKPIRHLQALNIGNINLRSSVAALVEFLSYDCALAKLSMKYNSIDADNWPVICGALKHNTSLTQLSIRGSLFNTSCGAAFADVLETNTTLTNLNMSQPLLGITAKGGEFIAKALLLNSHLRILSLSSSSLRAQASQAFSEALKVNTTLTWLNLSDNSFHNEGAKFLAEGLKCNKHLTYLDLSNNGIANEGADALGKAMIQNQSLLTLDLFQNGSTSDCMAPFIPCLHENRSLTRLNLAKTNLVDEGAEALANAIAENPSLRSVDISSCSFKKSWFLTSDGAPHPRLWHCNIILEPLPKENQ